MRKNKVEQSVRMSIGATHADRKWWWTQGRGSYNTDLINRISEIKREQYENARDTKSNK